MVRKLAAVSAALWIANFSPTFLPGKGGFKDGSYKAEANKVFGQADGIHQQQNNRKWKAAGRVQSNMPVKIDSLEWKKLKTDTRNIAVVAFSYQFTDIHKTVFCYKL